MKAALLIFGDDDYTAVKTVAAWRRSFARKYSESSIITIEADLEPADFRAQLEAAVSSQSLFNDVNLIIVNNVFDLNDEKSEDLLLRSVKGANVNSHYVVLRHRGTPDKRRRLYKQLTDLAKKGVIDRQELVEPSIGERARWVKRYCGRYEVAISEEVLDLLLQRCVGQPFWMLVQRVELLVTVADGEIDESAVLTYVPTTNLAETFKITDALAARDARLALKRALSLLLARQPKVEELVANFGAIAWVVRTMLVLKEGVDVSSIHPNVNRKLQPLLARWQLSELKELLLNLAELDFKVKNGLSEQVWAIEGAILSAAFGNE